MRIFIPFFILFLTHHAWATNPPSTPHPVTMTTRSPQMISEVMPFIENHNLYVYTVRVQTIDAINSVYITVVWDYDLEPSSQALARIWTNIGNLTTAFDAQAAALDWVEQEYTLRSPGELTRQLPDSPLSQISNHSTESVSEINILREQLRQLRLGYVTPHGASQ